MTGHAEPPGPIDEDLWASILADAERVAAAGPNGSRPHVDRAQLEFSSIRDLCARVDTTSRRWLLRGLWPELDYGVHGGSAKAQKTWNVVDLALSVASGTPWLGLVDVEAPGPVLMFAGEGGEANLVRRLRAVGQDLPIEDLPIRICTRAPHLSDVAHLGLMADELEAHRPTLVTIDPLYLSARGAKLGDLYAMGAVLEGPQRLCQVAGAALLVATHHNRGEGRGASRLTGAGPAEWGRVLVNATVISRRRNVETGETTVITELDAIGGEIADSTIRVTRRICPELGAALYYSVDACWVQEGTGEDLSPAAQKILEVLRHQAGTWLSAQAVGDAVKAMFGHGLSRPTISKGCAALVTAGLADELSESEGRQIKRWMSK
jgi:hypothetical protein